MAMNPIPTDEFAAERLYERAREIDQERSSQTSVNTIIIVAILTGSALLLTSVWPYWRAFDALAKTLVIIFFLITVMNVIQVFVKGDDLQTAVQTIARPLLSGCCCCSSSQHSGLWTELRFVSVCHTISGCLYNHFKRLIQLAPTNPVIGGVSIASWTPDDRFCFCAPSHISL